MDAAGPLSHEHVWRAAPQPEAPTLLLLHGTGGDQHDLIPLGVTLAPRANLLSPRGQVLEQGMPRFFRRHAEGVLDLDDLRARAMALADFVRDAAARYHFDAQRVIALGYSNGANVALGMLFERPHSLAGAVLARPVFPYEPDAKLSLVGKRALVLAGAGDPYSKPPTCDRLAAALRRAGADVELSVAPAGHELTPLDVELARGWLAASIKDE